MDLLLFAHTEQEPLLALGEGLIRWGWNPLDPLWPPVAIPENADPVQERFAAPWGVPRPPAAPVERKTTIRMKLPAPADSEQAP